MSGTPMIVITADRPERLRESGAPQTIDQIELYGRYATTTRDLPLPVANDTVIAWREAGREALSIISPFDPVAHLNAPFDEPLIPKSETAAEIVTSEFRSGTLFISSEQFAYRNPELKEYSTLLAAAQRPLIICGSLNVPPSCATQIAEVARKYGAPVLADSASQLRARTDSVSHGDLILRDPRVREFLEPDLILRIGGLPTSRAINEWIAASSAITKIGISFTQPADPDGCLTHHLATHIPAAIDVLASTADNDRIRQRVYRDSWMRCDKAAAGALGLMMTPADEIFEPAIVADVCRMMRRDMNLFLSNSMPIRWAEMYSGAHADFPRVFVNRGVNGIDGIISTAAGIARASSRTTVCILGDLTFLHDSNGLWRLKTEEVPLKLIVLNNDGGGVFHFLPIASHSGLFEPLVAMPHGVQLSQIASAHGIPHLTCASGVHFNDLFSDCLCRSGPEFIEIRTNRANNFRRHQDIIDPVAVAVRVTLGIA
jgi:2-succinyl-5-enolpyruvyl-6-hydroxy-3-cyclohexene-1-carboxylate synthase